MHELKESVGVSERFRALSCRLNQLSYKSFPKIHGEAVIIVRDAESLKIIRRQKVKNVITNAALNFFASLLANPFTNTHVPESSTTRVRNSWQLRLGTGTGTPSPTDTDLFNPIPGSYKSGSASSSGATTQYYVRYMPEDANGYTYTEAGIFENNGDTMINHLMLSPTLTKDSSKLVDFYVTITFS